MAQIKQNGIASKQSMVCNVGFSLFPVNLFCTDLKLVGCRGKVFQLSQSSVNFLIMNRFDVIISLVMKMFFNLSAAE